MILCTPTQMHAAQAIACLEAGKHVQVEIPLADSLEDAEAVVRAQEQGRARSRWSATRGASIRATSGCTEDPARRARIQQMDVQTYFFRRTNMNALGQPRSWTDHLLWHHAAHTVDLFAYQTGGAIVAANALQGPIHPDARHRHGHVDPAEGLRPARSARCRCRSTTTGRSARSFATSATPGPTSPATTTSYNGKDEKIDVSKVDVSMNGIELQDREFFAAIREGREPNASVAQVLPCYRTLDRLERQLAGQPA